MKTYSVWMEMPVGGTKTPFSRVAGDLTQSEAEWMAERLFFRARAMPDQPEGEA